MHTSPTIWRAAPGATIFLRELHANGIPIAAISNTLQPMAFEVLESAGLDGPEGLTVDQVFDSSVVGIAKPDPRLFHAAFNRLGVPAHEILHIGDSLDDDVEGAFGAGAVGVHMQPFGPCGVAGHADIVRFSDVDLMRGRNRGHDSCSSGTARVCRINEVWFRLPCPASTSAPAAFSRPRQ